MQNTPAISKSGQTTSTRRLLQAGATALALSVSLTSCVTNPATGNKDFTPFMSRSQERALGIQEHPKLLQEFGGVYADDAVSGYVAQVGGTMVANSELADQEFTFSLLNSDIVNAFALPGGFVYISRQLLGLMNSEAELASVLGHEVGHVTARHSAKRYNNAMFGNILAVGVGVATGSGELAQLAGQASQVYGLSYSRNQEFQADDLGIRYMSRAGYDPFEAADMLNSLGAQTSLDARARGQEADSTPDWARTHPLSADRVLRATQKAAATEITRGSKPDNRDRFLSVIDGLLMDDDPEQGFVRGSTFVHPKLLLKFAAPAGYSLQNGAQAVVARGKSGGAALFSGGKLAAGDSLANHLQKVWTGLVGNQNAPAMAAPRAVRINGMDAAISQNRVQGQSGPVDIQLVAYKWSADSAYHFVTLNSADKSSALQGDYDSLFRSLEKISAAEAAKYKPRRIRVVTVKTGDTANGLSSRMAYDDFKLERFLVLNALNAADGLQAGQKVKLIVYADK